MSSTTGEPKKSFLCCPAPFANCCGGPKNKPKPATCPKNGPEKSPTNNAKSPTTNEIDKKCDVKSNGAADDDPTKNPFLDDTENEDDPKVVFEMAAMPFPCNGLTFVSLIFFNKIC